MWPSIEPSKRPVVSPAAPELSVAQAQRSAVWGAVAALGTLGGFAAYALLSHWLMVNAAKEPWAVAVLFGPLVLALGGSALKQRQWWLLGACVAVVLVLTWVVAQGGVADANRMYMLQHAGIHLALAWTFGSTLRAGSTPLITAMARTVHEHFPPKQQAYTRSLTLIWAAYFLGMVPVSLLIYVLAPWPWWSLYGNVLTPLTVGLIFLVEHFMRYRLHPDFERITLRTAIQAYRRMGQPGGPRA